jgi:hypothetical protein
LLQISHTKRLVAINVFGDNAITSASGSAQQSPTNPPNPPCHLSLWDSIHLQRLLQKDKISEQHYIPGVPGKFRFRLGPGGWPLETVVVVVAGVAGWDVGGSAVLLPSPDDKLASPADALVMLDNVISSSSSGPPS